MMGGFRLLVSAAASVGLLVAEPLAHLDWALAQNVEVPEQLDQQEFQLYKQGRYGEAEPLAKRSLEIREKALAPDHPDIALSLNNLGELYSAEGRYAEAEQLHKQALEIREKALGPDDRYVATSLNNLAMVYLNEGRPADAASLLIGDSNSPGGTSLIVGDVATAARPSAAPSIASRAAAFIFSYSVFPEPQLLPAGSCMVSRGQTRGDQPCAF